MTRDFSNQRPENTRPSSRNTSSGRYREEPSSRPARPRLSRDTVDRAWENGASRNHADYHPRQNTNTSPASRPERPSPAFEKSPRQSHNQRPYETSQGRSPSPSPNRGSGYGYQQQHEQPSGPGANRFNGPEQRTPGARPGLSSERWTRDSSPRPGGYSDRPQGRGPSSGPRPGGYSDRPQGRGPSGPRPGGYSDRPQGRGPSSPRPGGYSDRYQGRGPSGPQSGGYSDRYQGRGPSSPQSGGYPDRSQERGPSRFRQDGPRPYAHGDQRRDNFARGKRTGDPRGQRDSYNPRWQSRPAAQRAYSESLNQPPETRRDNPAFQQDHASGHPGNEQFEGDYERFDTHSQIESPEQPAQPYEKHVTHLPDGRVLKGPRPVQRKQARFWSDVEEETTTLMPQTPAVPEEQEMEIPPVALEQPADQPAAPRKAAASKTHRVKTVKTTRARATGPLADQEKPGKKKVRGVQKPVTHPSQRGYQWPRSDE